MINPQKLRRRLTLIRDQWNRDSESIDVIANRDWIKGVVFGLSLAVKAIRDIERQNRRPRAHL